MEEEIREYNMLYDGLENEPPIMNPLKEGISHEEMEKRIIEIINEIYDE